MSFRRRLSLFFLAIVVIPMVSVAVVLFRLIDDSESGKADARVATQQEASIRLYQQRRDEALRKLGEIGRDRILAESLQDDDFDRAQKRSEQLVRFRALERVVIVQDGRAVVDAGDEKAVAPGLRPLASRSGRSFGRLEVSVVSARAYAREVKALTGVDVVVSGPGGILARTIPGVPESLPDAGDVEVAGIEQRVRTFGAPGFEGQRLRITTLRPEASLNEDVAGSRLTAGGLLLGFFVVAVIFALIISRSLQAQIGSFLGVARRIGDGDFTQEVPVDGHDEFALLGEEFNKMSRQLDARLTELRAERERVQGSMRRLGEAVASNLDRDALLEIVVRTAVEGVGADAGRASVCGPDQSTLQERSRVGDLAALRRALDSVEIDALRSGGAWEATIGDASALARPLRGTDGSDHVVGVVSVGRRGRSFSQSEKELFDYLAAQAAVSMENVDLHETAARESITDDLTGLANRRGFDEALSREVERARRFGDELSLVIFDLDDFKQVNDSYGHQQGDMVLREVARVVRETSREIDVPARYGGEELAVVLPGTDLEGAYNLAERVRERVEALRSPLLLEEGVIRVTTSAGVAVRSADTVNEEALVAAADAALYAAKRGGKNRSVRG